MTYLQKLKPNGKFFIETRAIDSLFVHPDTYYFSAYLSKKFPTVFSSVGEVSSTGHSDTFIVTSSPELEKALQFLRSLQVTRSLYSYGEEPFSTFPIMKYEIKDSETNGGSAK